VLGDVLGEHLEIRELVGNLCGGGSSDDREGKRGRERGERSGMGSHGCSPPARLVPRRPSGRGENFERSRRRPAGQQVLACAGQNQELLDRANEKYTIATARATPNPTEPAFEFN